MATKIFAFLLAACLLFVSGYSQTKGNPADDLVTALNHNRSSVLSTTLPINPGLGCIALQYIKSYKGICSSNSTTQYTESDIVNVYAPACRIDPSTLASITGKIINCGTEYAEAKDALSLLTKTKIDREIVWSNNHTEVGAAVAGIDGKGPYFWCLLFSNGHARKTFLTNSVGKGCFSGTGKGCSPTNESTTPVGNPADMIVEAVNANRTTYLSTGLAPSSGLGCLSLEYINAYNGNCANVKNNTYQLSASDIRSKLAPICGVDPNTLRDLSGSIIDCQTMYVEPNKAFSTLLVDDVTNLNLVYSNNHTQVGAAVATNFEKTSYFWSLLFSNGEAAKTFVRTAAVSPISGCYSGVDGNCTVVAMTTPPPAKPPSPSSPPPPPPRNKTSPPPSQAPPPSDGNRVQGMFWIVAVSVLAFFTIVSGV